MSISDVASTGDRRKTLEALRDHLAAQLDAGDYPPAPIAKQLVDVMRELDGLPAAEEGSEIGELLSWREARRPKAAGS